MAPHGGKRGSFKCLRKPEVNDWILPEREQARECEDSCGFWEPGDRRNGRARRSELAGLLRPLGRRAPDERGDPRPRAVGRPPGVRGDSRPASWRPRGAAGRDAFGRPGAGLARQDLRRPAKPLPELARQVGFFLQPGVYIHGLSLDHQWDFTPVAKPGDVVLAGDPLGTVPEGEFTHQIMVPLACAASTPSRKSRRPAATRSSRRSPSWRARMAKRVVTMQQDWPVKRAAERLAAAALADRTARQPGANRRFDVSGGSRGHLLHPRAVRRGQDRFAADHRGTPRSTSS